MTRKKSRPQHRENVSPKSANERGFYKMLWNSMEGIEEMEGKNNASAPSPVDPPQNSPTVIVINDSDDENTFTIDDSSGDNYSGVPLPIKQEFLDVGSSPRGIHQDKSDVDQSKETIEDDVPKSLQPTSLVQSSSVTALSDTSINSPPPDTDQRADRENVLRSPDRADSPKKVCPVSQSISNVSENSENNVDIDSPVYNVEHLSFLQEERTSSEPITVHENGHPFADVSQVCSISSSDHRVDDPSGNDCCIPLDRELVVNKNTCEDDQMPISQPLQNSIEASSAPAISGTTGQALELLKSLLVSHDVEDPPSLTIVNNDSFTDHLIERNDACNDSLRMNPNLTGGETLQSQSLSLNEVPLHSNQPIICPDQVVGEEGSHSVIPNVEMFPVDETIIPDEGKSVNSHNKDETADEFPVFGHIVPLRIKIEPSCIKRSLDLLKNELFALYNNCHVKEAFECKTDSEVVKASEDISDNDEIDAPNGTVPCLVMMERLPTPMVRKGYVTLGCKPFQNWKSRIIKLRNEEKFRHLGVWRRGRTRLWRECELAGMDKTVYDQQVNYIKKHMIHETSSSSESESSEDESADTSKDIYSAAATSSSDESEINELPSVSHTFCPSPENLHSDNFTNTDVSDSSIQKSPTKGKLRGPKSRRHSSVNELKVVSKEILSCREEYVVERNTVHDDHNSEGKKTAPLKITIRKASINKSEDEREKSVEGEVENSFTVPQKPTNKKTKRTFVTKRTYRKPEEHVPLAATPVENDTVQSSLQEPTKKRKVQSTPHYIEDNDEDEESLLGRRSYEVENFNLLEKWDIPFEEPTLFRSPRVASRLAQLKTKEAFTTKKNYVRQPAPQKPATVCKEVKEVVDLLCSKTEAIIGPSTVCNAPQDANHSSTLEPVNHTSEIETPNQPGALLSQQVPAMETGPTAVQLSCEDDTSETYSNNQEETNSTVDTSECGDSPKKDTEINPSSKRRKKTKFGYRKKKSKAKPCRNVDTSSTDEKIDAQDILGTNLLPRVLIPPLQSTPVDLNLNQVPVVSEGPGQSPQESEHYLISSKDTVAASKQVVFESKDIKVQSESPHSRKDDPVSEKPELVNPPRITRSKQPTETTERKEVIPPRLTRSKQPTLVIDPDVLENFGIRKKNIKSPSGRKNSASQNKEDVAKPTEQNVKVVQKKKSKMKSSLLQDSSSPAGRSVLEEAKETDKHNTQVHEVSEGPGEIVLDTVENLIEPSEARQEENTSDDKELECIDSHKGAQERTAQLIPDSPMSPTPDTVENEVVQPRMTRSKQRMLRSESAFIAVKMEESEKNTETKADPPLAPSDEGHVTLLDKSSTDVLEDVINGKDVSESITAISDQTSIIESTGKLKSVNPDLTECLQVPSPQPTCEVLIQNSVTKADNTTLSSMPISDSVVSLVHGSDRPCQNSPTQLVGKYVEPKADTSCKRLPTETLLSDFTDGCNSPIDPNTSKERQAVLETLNSILKLSSQNKKITDSLTSAGNSNLFNKKEEETIEFHVSDEEFDSGDAADGLVVDEDGDFNDNEDNSADLASRIDQIIKDQITSDIELPCVGKSSSQTDSSKTETGKENNKDSSGKRRDSVDERTGLPTVLMQKLRDPRIRSKIMSSLEDTIDSTPTGTSQSRPTPKDVADSTKASLTDTPPSVVRDPRAFRSGALSDPRRRVETLIIAPGSAPSSNMAVNDHPTNDVPSNIQTVARVAANSVTAIRDAANTPSILAVTTSGTSSPAAISGVTANPGAVLRGVANPNLRSAIAPTIGGTTVTGISTAPRGPLLPTPAALLPTVTALRNASVATNPNHNTAVTPSNVTNQLNKTEEVYDDEEEESLKRRPKKQKKEIDTELMYKSPLEDLQSEARPAYGRNPPRRNPRIERRSFSRTERGMHDLNSSRPSRWDMRYNDRRPERANPHYLESNQSYNHDHWGIRQVNDHINSNPTAVHPQNQNWYPEYNARHNDVVHQEPRLSYMDTHLLNLSLLPKTTNLNYPPFTKIYTYFNHGNPQVLRVAPPTYDPKEKASTVTMLDPMGQEMIDIVQLPRPTSGLTSQYFNDLPDEFTLEELVSNPYLALSDMVDEEVEIESQGTNIFDDSDEEQKLVRQLVKRPVNDPCNQSSMFIDKTVKISNMDSKKSVVKNDPLEKILHCLPALKEQYSFKKSEVIPKTDTWNDDSDNLVPPPPPTWSTEASLELKAKEPEKVLSMLKEDNLKMESWRNPSPPKRKAVIKSQSPTNKESRSKSPSLQRSTRRRSRSKSPLRRRSKSKSRSPERWKRSRSRSPYGRSRRPSRRSRSISPAYRSAYSSKRRSRSRSRGRARSRGRSRSSSLERLGRVKKHKRSSSISPSRNRHSRR